MVKIWLHFGVKKNIMPLYDPDSVIPLTNNVTKTMYGNRAKKYAA